MSRESPGEEETMMNATGYTIHPRKVQWDVWEFETRNDAGETVATVRMTSDRARELGLLPA